MDKIEAISPDPIHIEEHIWEANTCKWLSQIVYRVDLKGTKKVFSSARRKVSMEMSVGNPAQTLNPGISQ